MVRALPYLVYSLVRPFNSGLNRPEIVLGAIPATPEDLFGFLWAMFPLRTFRGPFSRNHRFKKAGNPQL